MTCVSSFRFKIASSLYVGAFLLISFPAFAQERWEKIYGGNFPYQSCGLSVKQTQDGGYIIAGGLDSLNRIAERVWSDVYLIKTDAQGDTLWSKRYGGGGSAPEVGWSVQQTLDRGYIIAGYTYAFGPGAPVYSDVYLVKTNAQGDTLWTKHYGGADNDGGCSVQQTADGGYIIAGWTQSFSSPPSVDIYLIKTNSQGDTLWTRVYGGTINEAGYSVQQTQDGGYIIAGNYDSLQIVERAYLIKTNAQGDTLWTRKYGAEYGGGWGSSVQQTPDGGYIIAGTCGPLWGDYDVYLFKTNAQGDTLWTRKYGMSPDPDYGRSVDQTTDGGYIVVGSTDYIGTGVDVYLVKTKANGDTLWTRRYDHWDWDEGYSVQQTQDGGFIISGFTFDNNNEDVYLIKTDGNGNSAVAEKREYRGSLDVRLKVIPNPFAAFAKVPGQEKESFVLYDISGRRVGIYRGDRIGEGVSPGVYFLRSESQAAKPLRLVKLR